jgi:hypothetical protein
MFVFVYFQYVMFFIFRSSVATDGLKKLHPIGPMCIADGNIGDDIAIGFPTSLLGTYDPAASPNLHKIILV